MKALVAVRELSHRLALRHALLGWQFDVHEADTQEQLREAVILVRAPHVTVLDGALGDDVCRETIQTLRAQARAGYTHVLLLACDARQVEELRELVDDVLLTPFTRQDLRRRLIHARSSHQARAVLGPRGAEDPMTGAWNQGYTQALIAAEDQPVSGDLRATGLVVFRARGLAEIAATHGTNAAASLLRLAVRRLQETLGPWDLVGRAGAWDLVGVLRGGSRKSLADVRARLSAALARVSVRTASGPIALSGHLLVDAPEPGAFRIRVTSCLAERPSPERRLDVPAA